MNILYKCSVVFVTSFLFLFVKQFITNVRIHAQAECICWICWTIVKLFFVCSCRLIFGVRLLFYDIILIRAGLLFYDIILIGVGRLLRYHPYWSWCPSITISSLLVTLSSASSTMSANHLIIKPHTVCKVSRQISRAVTTYWMIYTCDLYNGNVLSLKLTFYQLVFCYVVNHLYL